MNHSAKAIDDQRVLLIEAAGFGDAEFYRRWLLAAAQAQTILANIRNSDTGEAARLADRDVLLEPVGGVSQERFDPN